MEGWHTLCLRKHSKKITVHTFTGARAHSCCKMGKQTARSNFSPAYFQIHLFLEEEEGDVCEDRKANREGKVEGEGEKG